MSKQYNENFTPENEAEELVMLAGRVEAVGAYLSMEKYGIDKYLVAEMLGITLQEEKDDAKDNRTDGDSELD